MLKSTFIVGVIALAAPTSFAALASTNLGAIMPIGDSVTEGNSSVGAIPGGWRDPLYQRLTGDGYAMLFAGNSNTNSDPLLDATDNSYHDGFSGTETSWWTSAINACFPSSPAGVQPAIALEMLGTNDVYNGHLAGATDRMDQIIHSTFADDPGIHVFVSSILPNRVSAAMESDVQTYNAGLYADVMADQAAGLNVTWVDIGSQIDPSTDMIDVLHPNAAGDQIIANAWAGAIESSVPVPEPTAVTALAVIGFGLTRRKRSGAIRRG